MNVSDKLEDIIDNYETTRASYREYLKKSDVNVDTLIEYESRFIELKASLRPIRSIVAKSYEKRSDKQATAIKFRIAVSIHNGTFTDENNNLVYDKCSINQAEKFASASEPYKEFLEQKCFWKESYVNISDLREDLMMYINEVKDRIKSKI